MKFISPRFLILIILLVLSAGLLSVKTPVKFHVFVIVSSAKDHVKMVAAARPFLEKMAADYNFSIDITADTGKINDTNLAKYQVFVQLHEAPFDMSYSQQAALEKFIEKGKGWVGIHAAGLTGKDFLAPQKKYWQWFEDYMGGVTYSPHPAFQKGTVIIEDHKHPVTKNLPDRFEVPDEWYEFNKSPRSADEASYKQNKPMGDHPIIWTNEKFDRMIYIAIGHDASLCSDKNFAILVRDAILWAASPK
jgi:uncharacterized protein